MLWGPVSIVHSHDEGTRGEVTTRSEDPKRICLKKPQKRIGRWRGGKRLGRYY